MRLIFSLIGRVPEHLLFLAICLAIKLSQLPDVCKERRPRILADETCAAADGGVYAIVVKYAKFGLSEDFLGLLDSLRTAGVNAVVICNGRLADEDQATLRRHAHRVIHRPNIGRDFGAYRAATLHLAAQGLKPARVLYLNDSVYYIRGPELDRMLRALAASGAPAQGTFENHEMRHHLGSFAFSISGECFADPAVQRFWRDYVPYDLRPHAIWKGEIGFSGLLTRRGYAKAVLYSADKIYERLREMDRDALLRCVPLVSRLSREKWPGRLEAASQIWNASGAPEKPGSAGPDPGDHPWEYLARTDLIDYFMASFTARSQVHYGFGLYRRLMQCPIVKKDLLQRGVFFEQDCALILEDLPAAPRETLMRIMLNRGRPVHLPAIDHLLVHYGIK